MLKNLYLLGLLIFYILPIQSQSIIGKWRTLHEKTGKPVSIVEFYNNNGKVFGKIIDILEKEHKNDLCLKCKGSEKNTPILGLEIVKGLEKNNNEYNNGTIFHPVIGREFKCTIHFSEKDFNKIYVRGHFLFFYKTQLWERIN